MSRLRTTLSTAPIDRLVQGQVTVAERALQGALQKLGEVRKDEKYEKAHVARVRRDLERALGALQGVRRVVPIYDFTDPDLQPTAPYERPPEVGEVVPEVEEVVPEVEEVMPEVETSE